MDRENTWAIEFVPVPMSKPGSSKVALSRSGNGLRNTLKDRTGASRAGARSLMCIATKASPRRT